MSLAPNANRMLRRFVMSRQASSSHPFVIMIQFFCALHRQVNVYVVALTITAFAALVPLLHAQSFQGIGHLPGADTYLFSNPHSGGVSDDGSTVVGANGN